MEWNFFNFLKNIVVGLAFWCDENCGFVMSNGLSKCDLWNRNVEWFVKMVQFVNMVVRVSKIFVQF